MTLKQLQKDVDKWINKFGVRYFNELTNTALLNEEVGELSRLMARIYGEQSFKEPYSRLEQKNLLADEMADVIWVLTCLANQTGIDLTEAVKTNFDKKSKRDNKRHLNNPKLKE